MADGLATYKTRLNTGRSVIVVTGEIPKVREFVAIYLAKNPRSTARFEQYHYEEGKAQVELFVVDDE